MVVAMALSTEATVDSGDGGSDSLLNAIKHQQMLLFIVCGLGGALVVMLVICMVCRCKQQTTPTPRPRPGSKRNVRVQNKDPSAGKKAPKQTTTRTSERTRKRSRDMRNVVETKIGDSFADNDYRATNSGFLSP